jgi:hypothetical protein
LVNRLTSFFASNSGEDSLMKQRCASSFVFGVCGEIGEGDLPRPNPNRCSTVRPKDVFHLLWRESSSGTTRKIFTRKIFVRRSFCKPSHALSSYRWSYKNCTHHHAQHPVNSIWISSLFSSLHIPKYLSKEIIYQISVCPVRRQIHVTQQHKLLVHNSRPLTIPNESSKTYSVRTNFNFSLSFRYSNATQNY